MDIEALKELLIKDEGLKLTPYADTKGNITIGVGRNLAANGVSYDEAMFMLANDVFKACRFAGQFPWFDGLSNNRRLVIASLIFNMGYLGFLGFSKMIAALANKDFHAAANEMLSSKWAVQVGLRAQRLSDMMRDG